MSEITFTNTELPNYRSFIVFIIYVYVLFEKRRSRKGNTKRGRRLFPCVGVSEILSGSLGTSIHPCVHFLHVKLLVFQLSTLKVMVGT